MNFFAKMWWRITHMDESIDDYTHLYTLLHLIKLKKVYTSLKNTLTRYPDTPIYSLYPALFNAFTLYFNAFLPSHGFFNRLFQEDNTLLHNQFDQQSNWLNDLKLMYDQDNQQPMQKTSSGKEIDLHLTVSIDKKAEINNKKQMSPEIINPESLSTKFPKEDTEEAWTLWLTQIMNKPHTLEASLNAMRDHTKQLTKNPQTDLLRYTILSLLSVRWVEAIKWQNGDSMATEKASSDVKTNLQTLWTKIVNRHYHTSMDEKELESDLINEVLNSDECPTWIATKNKGNKLSEMRQQHKVIKETYRKTVMKILDKQTPQKPQKSIPEGAYINNMRI